MALRYKDQAVPPLPVGHRLAARMKYDQRLGRWRWGFRAALDQARLRTGRDLTTAEAVTAIEPELAVALTYIGTEPPDANVFGVIYELSSGRLGDTGKAVDSRKRAEATVQKAMAPETPDFIRPGFIAGAVDILYDVLKDLDPNELLAGCKLAHFLHLSKQPLDALAEWAEVYCRAISAENVLQKLNQDDPTKARLVQAYGPFLHGVLTAELASTSGLLDAWRLYEPARLIELRDIRTLTDVVKGVVELRVNWLNMVCKDGYSMQYYQLGPGTIQTTRNAVQALFKSWRNMQLPVYPRQMKEVLLQCVNIFDKLLASVIPTVLQVTEIKIKTCEALGEIPLLETIDVLKKYQQHPDPVIKKKVEDAIVLVGRTIAGFL